MNVLAIFGLRRIVSRMCLLVRTILFTNRVHYSVLDGGIPFTVLYTSNPILDVCFVEDSYPKVQLQTSQSFKNDT